MEDKNLHGLEEYENVANEVLRENPKGLTDITKETVGAVEKGLNKGIESKEEVDSNNLER